MIKERLNLSDLHTKQNLITRIGALKGPHRIEIAKDRGGRSGQANRYYWACVVRAFGLYLREQGNTHFSDEMAHEVLKHMFLRQTVIDDNTGMELTFTGSSAELSIEEFSEYLEKCIAFLTTDCGVIVQQPHQFA